MVFLRSHRRLLLWIAGALLAGVAAIAIIVTVAIHRAEPTLRNRITGTLRARFHGRVELGGLSVAAWHGFEVSGTNLRIYQPGVDQPLISLRHFAFHAPLTGLFLKPMHVASVAVTGLDIEIPPVTQRREPLAGQANKTRGKIEIVVDRIVCDDSRLVIANANPQKGPKVFELRHIELRNVSPNAPWRYQAYLVNAIPRGEIQSNGDFGPWQADSPGDTAVTGHYRFQHADLNTIKGLGGMLSSTGDFKGRLDRLEVDGTTETPDFSLDTANHPVPLHTRFHAIVDGITGDTYLQPVQATLAGSSFTAKGAVVDVKGKGHTIDLDVDVPAGRLQDFLALAVQTEPPVLTAVIGTQARLHIRAGKERVVQKLSIQGRFTLLKMHFTNPQVQDKVDMLSYRTRGEPEKAKPGAPDVTARMTGVFSLQHGSIGFSELLYTLPGTHISLTGVYTLDGQVFDFRGHVFTKAPLSKMVDSRWASLALKVVSPFFRGPHGGADIPVKISGTESAPKFGLDILGRHGSP